MFLKRRKWTVRHCKRLRFVNNPAVLLWQVLLIAIVLLMLSFNILFILDLTLNHDAHSKSSIIVVYAYLEIHLIWLLRVMTSLIICSVFIPQ